MELSDKLPCGYDLHITSGFRCVEYNSNINGSSKYSKHCLGQAIDCHSPGIFLADFLSIAESIEAFYQGGIGVYDGDTLPRLHLDVRMTGKARWYKHNGVFVKSKNLFT
jgi:uncharacterized protein YcbK (DUF882 family)